MLRVSRCAAVTSGFLVCVADGAESIRRSSETVTANGCDSTSLYQREVAGNGRNARQVLADVGPGTGGKKSASGRTRGSTMCLLTIVVITCIILSSNREVHP